MTDYRDDERQVIAARLAANKRYAEDRKRRIDDALRATGKLPEFPSAARGPDWDALDREAERAELAELDGRDDDREPGA